MNTEIILHEKSKKYKYNENVYLHVYEICKCIYPVGAGQKSRSVSSPAGLLHPVCLYRLYSTTLSPIIKIEISVISHWGVGKGLHTGKKKWCSLFFFWCVFWCQPLDILKVLFQICRDWLNSCMKFLRGETIMVRVCALNELSLCSIRCLKHTSCPSNYI